MAALRPAGRDRAAVEGRIRDALVALRAILDFDVFEAELIEFHAASGRAVVRVAGGCPGCDMSAAMLGQGIEAHLRSRVPEVRDVRIDGDVHHT